MIVPVRNLNENVCLYKRNLKLHCVISLFIRVCIFNFCYFRGCNAYYYYLLKLFFIFGVHAFRRSKFQTLKFMIGYNNLVM